MRPLTSPTENAVDKQDRSGRSFFGAMAGFVALDVVLLGCLLSPVAGLRAAPHAYRLTDRPIFLATPGATADLNKPSPVGDSPRATKIDSVVASPAFVGVEK
jgi:hypothetical protein